MGRQALLIATYEYEDSGLRQLTAPAHDAEALAAVLRDSAIAGFTVSTLINEPHHRVGQAIGDFYRSLRRDDLSLLYFTGHGLKDDSGRLYLAMTDTSRDNLLFTGLAAEQIDRALESSMSRQKVLVLDCCYSGAFPAGSLAKADSAVHTLERFQGRGRTVLTASDATQYSFEGNSVQGEAARSVFTRYLVAGLRDGSADLDGDGDITIDELYRYAYDRVVEEMPQQRPKRQDNSEGRTVIARNVNWTLPTYLRHSIASPIAADRLAALDGLAHLYRVGNDMVRERVEVEIRRLADDDSRKVSAAAAALLPRPTPETPIAASRQVEDPVPAQVAAPAPHRLPQPPPTVPRRPPAPQATLPGPVGWSRRTKILNATSAVILAVVVIVVLIAALVEWLGGTAGSTGPPPVITDFRGPVNEVEFSPDGKLLATISRFKLDSTLKLVDVASGQVTATLINVYTASFSPDGKTLAVVETSSAVRLVDVASQRTIAALPTHAGSAKAAFSPDGKLLATAGTCACSPDFDNPVRLWDAATGTRVGTLTGHTNGVQSMAFSSDGRMLAAGAAGNQPVRVWEVGSGKLQHQLKGGLHVAFSPKSNSLAASDEFGEKRVRLWDTTSGAATATLTGGAPVAFSPDGMRLAILVTDSALALVDVGTGKVTTPLGTAPMAFSPDSKSLAASFANRLVLRDLASGAEVEHSDHASKINDVAYSPDGRLVATASEDRTVRLWRR